MKKILFIIAIAIAFASCTKEPEVWDSSVKYMSGDWFVKTMDSGGALVEDYKEIHCYNTADDNGDMWIDLNNVILFSATIKVNTDMMYSFSGGEDLSVSEGMVELGKGVSKMGNTTDSFSMKVEKDGVVYTVEGHRKTGFPEDNY